MFDPLWVLCWTLDETLWQMLAERDYRNAMLR
jgi:hypothetical protein